MLRLRHALVWVPVLLLLAAPLLLAQPVPTAATYDELTNSFSVTFSSTVDVDPDAFVVTGITIDDDMGGPLSDFELRGGIVMDGSTPREVRFHPYFEGVIGEYVYDDGTSSEDRQLWGLDYDDLMVIEEELDHMTFDHMRMWCPAGMASDPQGNLSEGTWIDLTYVEVPSNDEVNLTDAEYDAASNTLTLSFNKVMQFDQIPEDVATQDPYNKNWPAPGDGVLTGGENEDRNGNGVLDFEANVVVPQITLYDANNTLVTLSSAADLTRMDSDVLQLQLLPAERATVEALDTGTMMIRFTDYTFVDVDYNPAVPVEDFAVEFTQDPATLFPQWAEYDMGSNELKVKFNQKLASNVKDYAVVPKLSIQRIEPDSTYSYALESGLAGLADSDSSLTVLMGVGTAHATEDLIDQNGDGAGDTGANLEFQVYVRSATVLSAGGNGNMADGVPLTIIAEDRNKGPELDEEDLPYYDADANELYLLFDVRLDAEVVFEGIHFISADDDTVTLTDGELERVGGNKGFSITISEEDQYALENTIDTSTLRMVIEPYTVKQSSKLNGNRYIEVEDFNYIADPNPPLIEYVWFDEVHGRFVIGTNGTVPAENVDLTKMQLNGIAIGAPESFEASEPNRISLYLSDTDVSAIKDIDQADRTDLILDFSEGFITTADGIPCVEQTGLMDGDTTANELYESVLVLGFGREFYIRSHEAFPTLPRIVQASLREVSPGALWYVANDQWGLPYDPFYLREGKSVEHPLVTPLRKSELDSAVTFFETRTPKLPDMGAKAAIDDLIGGERADKIPEQIIILLTDIWDEYGVGRNDGDAGFWKHGYFLPSDLPGNSTDEYSNEAELIVLDSYPQSYNTGDDAWIWNDNDEVWEEDDMDELDEAGLSAIANVYTQYVSYKVDKFEVNWVKYGLAYFTEFYTFRHPRYYGDSETRGLTGGNILTFIGSDLSSRVDYKHVFMYMLYLWEKYGGDDMLTAISMSPHIDIYGVADALSDRNEQLEAWQKDLDVVDVFLDFATANLIDTSYSEDDHNRFMFENINTQAAIRGGPMRWKTSAGPDRAPYQRTNTEWGFDYFFTGYTATTLNNALDPVNDNLVVFAGEGATDIAFRKVNMQATEVDNNLSALPILTQEIELEGDLNVGVVPISPGDGWVLGGADDPEATFPTFFLIAAGAGGDFLVHHQQNAAEFSRLFVVQNPVIETMLDVYVITEQPLYRSDGVSAPTVNVYADADMTEVIATYDSPDDFEMTSVENATGRFDQYVAHVTMTDVGEMHWALEGYYSNGVPVVESDPTIIVMSTFEGGGPSMVKLSDGFQVSSTARSFDRDKDLMLVRSPDVASVGLGKFIQNTDGRTPVSSRYSIGNHIEKVGDPLTLRIPYDVDAAGEQDAGVYLMRNDEWVYVGGEANPAVGLITVRVGQTGTYAVMAGPLGDVPDDLMVPNSFELGQNYPNPFNPSTTIKIALPQTGPVTLAVYDVLGREVTRLFDGDLAYGTHKFHFNGQSAAGTPIASGVYFVRMDAPGFNKTRKMVLVK